MSDRRRLRVLAALVVAGLGAAGVRAAAGGRAVRSGEPAHVERAVSSARAIGPRETSVGRGAGASQARGPDRIGPAEIRAAIDRLGDLDFAARVAAARTIRRAPAAAAVPALIEAVSGHAEGFVRFRALVLLTGFNDPRAAPLVLDLLDDPNDRLRTVAYAWIEHHHPPDALPRLRRALEREQADLVRPALVRALAAYGDDADVRRTVVALLAKEGDLARAALVEALGDRRATYAYDAVLALARRAGPLQDDAVLALGRMGDRRALPELAALQRTAPRDLQPAVAAAICLLGSNCPAHTGFLVDTLRFAVEEFGFQPLLRAAARALAALGAAGHAVALEALLDEGAAARDPARAPIALAAGTVALRHPKLALDVLAARPQRDAALELLREAFDMLEEDYLEERFFVFVRRAYWEAPDGSPLRDLGAALIRRLEF